jgi:hypothetical protein
MFLVREEALAPEAEWRQTVLATRIVQCILLVGMSWAVVTTARLFIADYRANWYEENGTGHDLAEVAIDYDGSLRRRATEIK